jgi:hypothetical protein
MSGNWIAVASAEHVALGRAQGFMQVCHGKGGPLRRIRPGDRVVYYSPTQSFKGKERLQAFTAIGVVREPEPYLVEMAPGFRPFRRDITWIEAREASILPLCGALEFTSGGRNWGQKLRFGLVAISDSDMGVIAEAMGARLPN